MTDFVADGAIEQLAGHVEDDVRFRPDSKKVTHPNCKLNGRSPQKLNQRWAGIKVSELASGIKITPNFMLAMLFLAFTAWLFVVYWIRRHEPLANSVLGQPRAIAPTAKQDLVLMNNARNAMPIKTGPNYNGFYTPEMKNFSDEAQLPLMSDAQTFAQQSSEKYLDTSDDLKSQQEPSQVTGSWNPAAAGAHSLVLRGGREQIQVTHPEPIVTSQPPVNSFQPPAQCLVTPQTMLGQSMHGQMHPVKAGNSHNFHMPPQPSGSAYQMHVQEHAGPRLKTVVNR